MKKLSFKSVSLFFILLALTIFLAACGTTSSNTSKPTNGETASEKEDTKGEKKVLRVGTSGIYPPFVSQGKNGKLEGYDVEVLETVGKALGYEIEWTVAEFSGLFGMMDSGKIDTIANLITVTDERKEKYDFSSPYAFSGATLVVKKDRQDINGLEDLKGKSLGVLLGNNLHGYAEEWNKANGNEIIIKPYQDVSGTYNEVALGRIDAFIDAKITAVSRIANEGLPLKLYSEEYLYEFEHAFPFVRNNENKEFLQAFNAEIEKLSQNGTLKKLSDKWSEIDVTKKPKNSN